MTTYIFKNAGVIDPRAITTFGVSSKECKSPIGFFGTGLKYAIAVLLRLGCRVSIHSGTEHYEFDVETARIRVNDFNLVRMNGVPCGFTSELGKNWEAWQAFRELACNCIDEGGEYYKSEAGSVERMDNCTLVCVEGAAFAEAWLERDSVLLDTETRSPILSTDHVEIYEGTSRWMYYRGVRVRKLHKPSLFTYNILRTMALTEDRTFKYDWEGDASVIVALQLEVEDQSLLETVLLAPEEVYERSLIFSGPASNEFKAAVTKQIKAFDVRLNHSAKVMVQRIDLHSFVRDETLALDYTDAKRLHTATKFLSKLGYEVSEYPIIVTEFLGDGVLGRAVDGRIYISKRTMMMGTKMLAGTLLEEYLHLKHSLPDESRQMQNFLLDALISAGERSTRMTL